MQRRRFLQLSASIAGITPLLNACNSSPSISGKIVGASSTVGHLLRDGNIQQQKPVSTIEKKVVIVGGGISGLSAARWLQQHGVTDFILLDLEKETGGNAASGRNETSAFSWGAHYITIPNNNLKEYNAFLEECNIITGYNNQQLPIINEYYLCHDPQERLYINGNWQDGLIPNNGLKQEDKEQLQRFLQLMHTLKSRKGKDRKDAFDIPINNSSKDEEFTVLDNMTMKEWLLENRFTSEYLHEYVNYCTRDDFGTNYGVISAWVGIHYFAARKGVAANAEPHDVITWPSGNAWLAKELQKTSKQNIQTNALVTNVHHTKDAVVITYYNTTTKQVEAIIAKQLILATPQFVNNKLLLNNEERKKLVDTKLHYSPWMVANIHTQTLTERSGAPQSWDNVIFNSESLGYIKANHQLLGLPNGKNNLTYYLPLTTESPSIERKKAYNKTHTEWVATILNELKIIHPNIEQAVQQIDVILWGHAMAQPLPNLIHSNIRAQLQKSIDNKIHFAHTDLAGISIFEEAFYQGIQAAKKVIQQL